MLYLSGLRALLRRIWRREQLLASAGQGDNFSVCDVAPVLGAKGFDANDVPDFQRIPGPAIPQELVRAIHFEAPIRHSPVIVFDVQIKPGVGIGPLEFRDRPRDLHRLRGVEFSRKCMMCNRRPRAEEQPDSSNANRQCFSHRSTSSTKRKVWPFSTLQKRSRCRILLLLTTTYLQVFSVFFVFAEMLQQLSIRK